MSGAREKTANKEQQNQSEKPLPGTGIPPEKKDWEDIQSLKRHQRREEERIRRTEEEAEDFPTDNLDPLDA